MPQGGLLLGDLVKQQDFRGSGEFHCNASWFSWVDIWVFRIRRLWCEPWVGFRLHQHSPGRPQVDVQVILTSTHRSQISATPTRRTTITTQTSPSWPQSLNHLDSILVRHLEPRPSQTSSEGNGTGRILKDYFGGFENHCFNPAWALFESQRMLSDAVSSNLFDISTPVIGHRHFSPQWYWNWEFLLNSGVRPSILVQSKVQTVWSAS